MRILINRYDRIGNINAPSFLTAMAQLMYLRDLRLDIYPMSPAVLASIYQLLPRFTALSDLVLSLRSYENENDSMELINAVTSGCNLYLPSLRTLSISTDTPHEDMITAFNKLLEPASSPVLERLFLEITRPFGNSDRNAEIHRIIDAFEETLGRLTAISVAVHSNDVAWDLVLPKLFACTRSVKRLFITVDSISYVSLEALQILPRSVEELIILFPTWRMTWGSHDEELRMFVTDGKRPKLRKLSVGYSYEIFFGVEEPTGAVFMTGTEAACRAKNVVFVNLKLDDVVDGSSLIRDWY